MTNQGMTCKDAYTPWAIVRKRFFHDEAPSIAAFSAKHGLNAVDVLKLFSGEVISFSLEMCAALRQETGMSKDFFRNLSNSWRPQLPPAGIGGPHGPSFLEGGEIV